MSQTYTIVPDRLDELVVDAKDVQHGDLIADEICNRSMFGRKVESTEPYEIVYTDPLSGEDVEIAKIHINLNGSAAIHIDADRPTRVLRPVWELS